ncbi:MAG: signal peptidase I [Oscillospiraceae bacterium]|nr:signal peptidase I [Oscillospiraceae bacterium]
MQEMKRYDIDGQVVWIRQDSEAVYIPPSQHESNVTTTMSRGPNATPISHQRNITRIPRKRNVTATVSRESFIATESSAAPESPVPQMLLRPSSEAPVSREPLTAPVTPMWKSLLLLLAKIASIAIAFVLLFTFVFGIIQYHDPSMVPAIKDGDLVIFYRNNNSYQVQDTVVVVFEEQQQVRRVVANEGDIVDITEEGLMVNGACVQEREIYQITEPYQDGVRFPLTVPDGCVFLLGDSRISAADSRIYGPVKITDTQGKVMAVIRRRGI